MLKTNKAIGLFKNALTILALATLFGCNTFSGMGKDISSSADWAKGKMNGQDSATNQQDSASQSKTNSTAQPAQKTQPTK